MPCKDGIDDFQLKEHKYTSRVDFDNLTKLKGEYLQGQEPRLVKGCGQQSLQSGT